MKSIFRVGLGLAIVAGLATLVFQNATPTLVLTFLGMRSQPLSLGWLVLAAVGAGVASGLTLLTLLRLSNFFARQTPGEAEAERPTKKTAPSPPQPGPPPDDEWDIETPPSPWSSPQSGPWPEPEAPIYDADFRVIRPPQAQNQPPQPEDKFDFEPDVDEPPRRRSPFRKPNTARNNDSY
jgi:hypothetical protein